MPTEEQIEDEVPPEQFKGDIPDPSDEDEEALDRAWAELDKESEKDKQKSE